MADGSAAETDTWWPGVALVGTWSSEVVKPLGTSDGGLGVGPACPSDVVECRSPGNVRGASAEDGVGCGCSSDWEEEGASSLTGLRGGTILCTLTDVVWNEGSDNVKVVSGALVRRLPELDKDRTGLGVGNDDELASEKSPPVWTADDDGPPVLIDKAPSELTDGSKEETVLTDEALASEKSPPV